MDPYEILGVERDASLDEIRQAYRNRSKTLHPDIGGSERAFVEINAAYSILKDPERRRRFDATGDTSDAAEPPSAAHMALVAAYQKTMSGIFQSGDDPLLVNFKSRVLAVLEGMRDQVRAERQNALNILDKLAAMSGRFTSTAGHSAFEAMRAYDHARMGEKIKEFALHLAAIEAAVELLATEDYRFDAPPPPPLHGWIPIRF